MHRKNSFQQSIQIEYLIEKENSEKSSSQGMSKISSSSSLAVKHLSF